MIQGVPKKKATRILWMWDWIRTFWCEQYHSWYVSRMLCQRELGKKARKKPWLFPSMGTVSSFYFVQTSYMSKILSSFIFSLLSFLQGTQKQSPVKSRAASPFCLVCGKSKKALYMGCMKDHTTFVSWDHIKCMRTAECSAF